MKNSAQQFFVYCRRCFSVEIFLSFRSSFMKLPLFCFFAFVLCHNSFGQKKKSIEIYANPFIYKGNVNKQYTNVNNKYVDGHYTTPYIFECGFNYKVSHKEWGWYAGLSFMSEQQYFQLNIYTPSEYYVYEPKEIFQFDFKSNFIGLKGGIYYEINKKLNIAFNLTIFKQIVNWSRELSLKSNTIYQSIFSSYSPSPEQMEEGYQDISYLINVKADNQFSYPTYFVPELSFDYGILPNTSLVFGTRLKFWSREYYDRFAIKVDGYFDDTDAQYQTFHESKIRSRGIYTYLGLKYNIPLVKK